MPILVNICALLSVSAFFVFQYFRKRLLTNLHTPINKPIAKKKKATNYRPLLFDYKIIAVFDGIQPKVTINLNSISVHQHSDGKLANAERYFSLGRYFRPI